MTTPTITHIDASRRLLAFAAEDRLIQGSWHTERDGRQLACALGAMGNGVKIDSPEKCPSSVMPAWLAYLVVGLFDGQKRDAAIGWATRFGAQMGQERWSALNWERVRIEFLIGTITEALDYARPRCRKESYWAAVESSAKQVQEALRGNGDLVSAASAAWSAASAARSAESAARSAESAARSAESAARSAESAARSADSAAWSAASAARSAESAAWSAESAARSAAWSAASAQANRLCDLIDRELSA
jgi:hypothetical protein